MTQKVANDNISPSQDSDLNEKILDKLKKIQARFNEISQELEKPENYQNHKFLEKLNKEKVRLQKPNELFSQYLELLEQISDARDLINNESDKEIKQLAQEELKSFVKEKSFVISELNSALVEKDPNDSKDIFLEIRAGTGGDEAAIFVGDLNKMYTRYSEKQSWDIEIVNSTESDHGGFKEIMLKI
ncbi:MAG: PCRF domain-containing protein, partial [Pseudomonadota bacterium]|nr:PCRF domain-containing protein [Pseudomonadota bacterium]